MLNLDYLLLLAHLIGAAIWVGGHLVLALAVLPHVLRAGDVAGLLAFESRFEPLGMPALIVQAVTGIWLALRLQPELAAWLDLGDPVSRALLAKLGLLAATLGLALNARLRVIPRLSVASLPLMALHIRAVTLIGMGFVLTGVSFRFGGFWL